MTKTIKTLTLFLLTISPAMVAQAVDLRTTTGNYDEDIQWISATPWWGDTSVAKTAVANDTGPYGEESHKYITSYYAPYGWYAFMKPTAPLYGTYTGGYPTITPGVTKVAYLPSSVVPEPSTLALLAGSGLLALLCRRRS